MHHSNPVFRWTRGKELDWSPRLIAERPRMCIRASLVAGLAVLTCSRCCKRLLAVPGTPARIKQLWVVQPQRWLLMDTHSQHLCSLLGCLLSQEPLPTHLVIHLAPSHSCTVLHHLGFVSHRSSSWTSKVTGELQSGFFLLYISLFRSPGEGLK